MVKKKVLIAGGNGYIGSRLSIYLSDKGYSVTAICFPTLPQNKEWVSKIESVLVGDITNELFLNKLSKFDFDYIVNLISLDHSQSNGLPTKVCPVNITPTWSLFNIFAKKGLRKFIYFSTIHVYGSNLKGLVSESTKVSPSNPYALTHLLGEQICEYYNKTTSIESTVVRLSNSYGYPIFNDNNCWWLVINDLCKSAVINKEIILQSDGTPVRDFIHGWDVCFAIQNIIETNVFNSIYNISSGETISILSIAKKIQHLYYLKYNTEIKISLSKKNKSSKTERYTISNHLIRSVGYKPQWNTDKGINDLLDYLEINKNTLKPFLNNK